MSGTHPDIIHVKPAGTFIKIDQIRALCQALTQKPYETGYRIVIITNAQSMNMESSNGILKALEEPPERTVFLLIAGQKEDLLPTIVSRCQHIGFNPISKPRIADILIRNYSIDPDTARVLSSMSEGSISKALSLNTPKLLKMRMWIFNQLTELSGEALGLKLAFAEKISKNKNNIAIILELMQTFYRDMLIYRYAPDKIINIDKAEAIGRLSSQVTDQAILSKIDLIRSTINNISSNAVARLSLEVLAVKLL